jgi:putative redox protein
MSGLLETAVVVTESGIGPYAQFVTAGRHVMGADEPERLGGRDTGPSPYDFLLAGLGACTAMTMRIYATKHAWHVERISVDLRHEKFAVSGTTVKSDRFERVITLIGQLTDEQRAQLLEIADKCPVSQTLRQTSVVISRLA